MPLHEWCGYANSRLVGECVILLNCAVVVVEAQPFEPHLTEMPP